MLNLAVEPIDRILSALDELADAQPKLEAAIDFYEELLPLMARSRPSLHGLTLDPAAARDKLAEGVPILWGEYARGDAPGLAPDPELFLTLCRRVAEGGAEDGERLARAYLEGGLDLKALAARALVQDHAGVAAAAAHWQVDTAALEAVLRFLLTPIATAYAVALERLLEFDEWRRGYCPVCGAWPVLAQLLGRDKLRYLACGRCGVSWRYRRLQCVWCGTREQKRLGFLYYPEEARRRVDVCDECGGYVKTLVTFDAFERELLLVRDLETVAMDQMAASEGYHRPRRQPTPDA